MAGILQYQRGRDVSGITITAQTVSATGVFSDDTANTGSLLTGKCDGIRISAENNTEVIMGVDDIIINNVAVTQGYSIELTEILTKKIGTATMGSFTTTSYQPILPYLYTTAGDYFKVVIVKGGKTYTIFGVKASLTDGVTGQGKQTASMSLVSCNVNWDASGVASLAYS